MGSVMIGLPLSQQGWCCPEGPAAEPVEEDEDAVEVPVGVLIEAVVGGSDATTGREESSTDEDREVVAAVIDELVSSPGEEVELEALGMILGMKLLSLLAIFFVSVSLYSFPPSSSSIQTENDKGWEAFLPACCGLSDYK